MITDEKRRDIARGLRTVAERSESVPGVLESEIFCILEIGVGGAEGFADRQDVLNLADLIDCPISGNEAEVVLDETDEAETTPREIAAELRHAANYGDSETLAGWWNRLQSAVLRDDDFPDPRETFKRLAELIDTAS